MKIRAIVMALLCVSLTFGRPGAAQSATLSRFTTTDTVDEVMREPVGSNNVFEDVAPKIWAVTYIENAKAGDSVVVVWEILDPATGDYVTINKTTAPVEGTRYAAFSITPDTEMKKFPAARYRVRMFLNSEESATLYFRVQAGNENTPAVADPESATDAAATLPAVPPKVIDENYMLYTDPEGRFSAELPGKWFPAQVSGTTALYLSQNKENSPIATIAVTAIPAKISKVFNRTDAMIAIRDKLLAESKEVGAEVIKDEFVEGESPEQHAWVLAFRYKEFRKKTVDDRKIIMCPGEWVYTLTSICEPEAGQKYRADFERFISTFVALK